MGMGIMALKIKGQLGKKLKLISVISIVYASFCHNSAFAIDFIYLPSVTLQGTYSDNVRLAPKGQEKGAFVTELSPGISIRGVNGGRLTANLDYRLQTLFNAGGDGSTQVFSQLNFDSAYAVIPTKLYVGMKSAITQQSTTNLRNGDNINNLGDRTNVYTVNNWVNWTPHFGSFADADLFLDLDYIGNDNAQALSNSINMRESISVVSGHDFSRITWVANFDNTSNFRENGEDVHFQNTDATVRSWVDYRFNLFTTIGYANNSFEGLDTDDNGFFYTLGAQWIPNRFFDLEAGYGNNWHVSGNMNLTRRTHIGLAYFDRSVGLNTGGAWSASLDHRTKRTLWRFSYNEDTTTVQDILSEDSPFTPFDAEGNQIDSQAGQTLNNNVNLPFLTNDVLIRKIGEASVSYLTGKSVFRISGFHERRDYSSTDNYQETVYGADASWNWRITRRTSLFLAPSWQHIQRGDNTSVFDSEDDRYEFITRLTRTIPVRIGRYGLLSASLEYRFLKQDSTLAFNTYIENRVTASLFMNF